MFAKDLFMYTTVVATDFNCSQNKIGCNESLQLQCPPMMHLLCMSYLFSNSNKWSSLGIRMMMSKSVHPLV